MTDRPKDHLTCSALARTLSCPGWYRLWLDLGCPASPDSADSSRGTELHAELADIARAPERIGGFSEVARKLWQKLEVVLAVHGGWGSFTIRNIEARLYHPTLPISGQPDLVLEHTSGSLWIVDWKTGQQRTSAEANPQLAGLAALTQHPSEVWCVTITEQDEAPAIVVYQNTEELHAELVTLYRHAVASDDIRPDPETCKWCPCLPQCAAAARLPAEISGLELAPGGRVLTPEQVGKIAKQAGHLRKFIDAAVDYAREHPESCGVTLTKGQIRRVWAEGVTVETATNRLGDIPIRLPAISELTAEQAADAEAAGLIVKTETAKGVR
jgi:hypothetical protein